MRRLVLLLVLVPACFVAGCGGGDDPPAATVRPNTTPEQSEDYSVCAWHATPTSGSGQTLIGPCSVRPTWEGEQVYLDENGADGSSLAHAYDGAPLERELIADPDLAAQFRQRIKEITEACREDRMGCISD